MAIARNWTQAPNLERTAIRSQAPVSPHRLLIRARHVLPIASPAIRDGAVLVEGGRIAWFGPKGALDSESGDTETLDLGEALLLPGLVNTHSHLEYTLMRGFGDTLELFPWVRRLTALKYTPMTAEDFRVSALAGAAELIRAGVTCTADCSDAGEQTLAALTATGLRGVLYQELFGPDPAECAASLAALEAKLDRLRAAAPADRLAIGISPHAPYTVSAPLFRAAAAIAARLGLRVAIHAAESPAEVSFVRDGSGPIAEFFERRRIDWRPAGAGPVRYLEQLGLLELGRTLLLIHCAQAGDDELATIARAGAGLAHCPRSNAKLGNGGFVLPLDGSLPNAGFGTDSAASNNALSVLEEVRFAALMRRVVRCEVETVPADRFLETATLGGARALGLEDVIGSIEVGKSADLAAFALDTLESAGCGDAASALVFGAPPGPARLTMVAGEVLCRDGRLVVVDGPALLAEANGVSESLRARFRG